MDEVHELQEHAEHGAEHDLASVTVSMAVLAVLVAAASLLGHRAHTEELLLQTRATDEWAYYQAKDIRRHAHELFLDELSVFAVQSSEAAATVKAKYTNETKRYRDQEREIKGEAEKAEKEVSIQQARADRFDLGEVMLEAALVICSITLLTKKRLFWHLGMAVGAVGVVIAVAGLFIHG